MRTLVFFLEVFELKLHLVQADIILANSKFTARITKSNFTSMHETPKVVYPGINIAAYEQPTDLLDQDIIQVSSYVLDTPTVSY